MQLDHLILPVNDKDKSIAFYENVLGFWADGDEGPFTVLRVSHDFTMQVAPWGTEGGMHFAFAMPHAEFEERFDRIKASGVSYGSTFDDASNMEGPGHETGARGATRSLYLFDPNQHLFEFLYYED